MDLLDLINAENQAMSCVENITMPAQSRTFTETRKLSITDHYKGNSDKLYGSIKSQMVSNIERSIGIFKQEITSHPYIDSVVFEDRVECIRTPDSITVTGYCVITFLNGYSVSGSRIDLNVLKKLAGEFTSKKVGDNYVE